MCDPPAATEVGAGLTVSTFMFVLVPPAVVTRIGPDDTPDAGTVTVMLVGESTVIPESVTPFSAADVTPARFVPVSVTTVSAPGRTMFVLYAVTVGTTAVVPTVNDADAAVPAGVTTRIGPVVAPVGTDVTKDVADSTVNGALTPLKVTALTPTNPVPITVTDSPRPPEGADNAVTVGNNVNVAVTDAAAVIDTVHDPVPAHETPVPDQPENTDPDDGVADSVTDVPCPNEKLHVAPHDTPTGFDVTVPVPVPAFATVSAYVFSANIAVTDLAAVIETVHDPVPAHEIPVPDQPVNVDDTSAVADSVTDVPDTYDAEHDEPQSTPAKLEVTVPEPVPDLDTVST